MLRTRLLAPILLATLSFNAQAADALRTAERLALAELLKSPVDEEHAQRLRKRLDALK